MQDTTSKPRDSIITPFSVKPRMTLAKCPKSPLRDTTVFDRVFENQESTSTYIQECKSTKSSSILRRRTMKEEDKMADDVDKDDVIITSPTKKVMPMERFKLLQFCENHRPAYYGTWRKKRGLISARNPFRKDEV